MNTILPPEKQCCRRGCEKTQTCYFALLPFEGHLREIFSSKYYVCIPVVSSFINLYVVHACIDYWTEVQYPFTRQAIEGCIQDIHDGRRYQKLSGPGKLFSVPERTGLILCADGVPLFKSSGNILHASLFHGNSSHFGASIELLPSCCFMQVLYKSTVELP